MNSVYFNFDISIASCWYYFLIMHFYLIQEDF